MDPHRPCSAPLGPVGEARTSGPQCPRQGGRALRCKQAAPHGQPLRRPQASAPPPRRGSAPAPARQRSMDAAAPSLPAQAPGASAARGGEEPPDSQLVALPKCALAGAGQRKRSRLDFCSPTDWMRWPVPELGPSLLLGSSRRAPSSARRGGARHAAEEGARRPPRLLLLRHPAPIRRRPQGRARRDPGRRRRRGKELHAPSRLDSAACPCEKRVRPAG
jgi:hypothetical protein